jgi:hypothetical protein
MQKRVEAPRLPDQLGTRLSSRMPRGNSGTSTTRTHVIENENEQLPWILDSDKSKHGKWLLCTYAH